MYWVYGRRQRPDLAIHKFTKLIFEGKPIPVFGDGSTKRDYTYIDDIIKGIISAINYASENYYEIINLGGGEPVNLEEMIRILENTICKKAIIERKSMQKGDVIKTVADITKAKKLLNFLPSTKFKDGIKLFIDWYKNHNCF